jgi:hypothetical protein
MADVDVSDSGMELRDLLKDEDFAQRTARKRDFQQPFEALSPITKVYAERPEEILQELVQVAANCCGADSAGISLEEPNEVGEPTFRWVAIAGTFSQYLHGRTPRFFSPCGSCLDSGRPQLYRVTKPYYDFLGASADAITEGILIPWEADGIRGTIWVISHQREEIFERQDYELVKGLADFIAITVRQRKMDESARELAKAKASADRAHEMAHAINNPLQKLTNTMFLAQQRIPDSDKYLDVAAYELAALSERVKELLALKYQG